MRITATALTQLDTSKDYYLSNTTGTIKEAGLWQRFKCWTGWGDGRAKVVRLADAIKTALLADASIKSEEKLAIELGELDKTRSLSGADLYRIASRFKAEHAQAVATSDACRVAETIVDEKIQTWAERGDVLPEAESLKYIKKLCLYAAQQVTDNALSIINDPKLLTRKIRRNLDQVLICLNAAENMKKKDVDYPKAEKCKDANGRTRILNPPRFRLDELHFRAFLGMMATKYGPATFSAFARAIVRGFPEAELQKRKETILNIPLAKPTDPGSGVAFAAQMAKSHELYNASLVNGIKMANPRFLPAAFNKAEDAVVAEMRERFGAGVIAENAHANSLIVYNEHIAIVESLVANANAEGRTVGADEVKAAIREKCLKGAAEAVLNNAFKQIAAERGLPPPSVSQATQYAKMNPGAVADIIACDTPEAALAAARRHEDDIVAKMQLHIDAGNARAELPARAAAMIAESTGMDVAYIVARLNTDKLLDKARAVVDNIDAGKVEGVGKPGFDVKTAFQGVLDEFVNSRLAIMKEIDNLDGLSDDLKRKWKNLVISTYKAEKLNPAKIHKLLACGHFSDKMLVDALSANGTAAAAEKICSYMGSVNAHFVELFGQEEWEDMGNDERVPVLNMALLGVMDKNPSIAEKFLARGDELMGALNTEFDRPEFFAQGDGRKVVEGLYTILVGVDGQKVGE